MRRVPGAVRRRRSCAPAGWSGACATPRTRPSMFSNPKRVRSQFTDKERWFDYYAGYSPAFVRDVIQRTCGTDGHVLDPWNGSGTTTATAREMGAASTGIDINPVMVVVAKAKLVTVGLSSSLMPIADDLVSKAARAARPMDDDPLHEWFVPASAGAIRSLTEAVCELLTPPGTSANLYAGGLADQLSDLAAFFLVAVFRTTRTFISRFRASNPTWIKSPLTPKNRVRPTRQGVLAEFRRQVQEMAAGVGPPGGRQVAATIVTGSAERLPLADASVDAVVASPPYCTRIDYAVATKPELAVLGCPLGGQFESLRRRLTGGPVVAPSALTPAAGWGAGCLRFLEAVLRADVKLGGRASVTTRLTPP